MKLRCVKDSIRFRLRKSDVAELMKKSKLRDSINFPSGASFSYGLVITEQPTSTHCENNCMSIELNRAEVEGWANSNEVSLHLKFSMSGNRTLSILIEKDFPCKHTGDDFDDTYHELQPEEHRMYKKSLINLN